MAKAKEITYSQTCQQLAEDLWLLLRKCRLGDSVLLRVDEVSLLQSHIAAVKGKYAGLSDELKELLAKDGS